MTVDDCFQIGAIIKTHGFKGEVVLHLDVDDPEPYKDLESIFLEHSGKLIPFFIAKSHLQRDKLRVQFEEVGEETAKKIVGAAAYLPLEFLPDLGDKEYYLHEVIGYKVIQNDQEIGVIHEIYDQQANPLFGFKMKEHEVLVPFKDEFVIRVNKSKGEIHVNLPNGYLDIYLDEA